MPSCSGPCNLFKVVLTILIGMAIGIAVGNIALRHFVDRALTQVSAHAEESSWLLATLDRVAEVIRGH